jgi:glycosyltransferase involved in cell wall biosynthesis
MAEELRKNGIESRVYVGHATRKLFKTIPIPNLFAYLSVIFQLRSYDILLLHRHGNPLAYMILLLAKLLGKKVVLDFDDALFALHKESRHKILNGLWYSFFPEIVKRSDMVIAGGHFLAEYAARINANVHIIPSPVDTSVFLPRSRSDGGRSRVTVGWVGLGNFHADSLKLLCVPLEVLSKKYSIRLKIISYLGSQEVKQLFNGVESLEVDYGLEHLVPLSQIPDLISDFDISVMPLVDNNLSRGHCAMKILESMAMGIPVVASALGENNYVIEDGVNGYLAATPEEWIRKLETLIQGEALRKRIGQNGLETIRQKGYTLEECGKRLSQLCNQLLSD